ncbi:MAG: isomerizing glutamine--fructose-6-phosphate transaminase, partial [Ardenticatenaceae bacterium]
MCGIIGYTGPRSATPILLDGLTSLEYRGYDSAGIAVLSPVGETHVHKASGKLGNLKEVLSNGHSPQGTIGIGHTRWATHGDPTDFNAHPHADCKGDVVVVHNGIVENYVELKKALVEQGHIFRSETDSECVPHLIESFLAEEMSLEDAVRATALRLRGANAIVVVSRRFPDRIVAVRLGNAGGIVVGYGQDEMVLASDIPAILPHTRDIVYLSGGEIVSMTHTGAHYSTLDGLAVEKEVAHVDYDEMAAVKGDYEHFLLKEIHEQPEAMIDTLRGRISPDFSSVELEELAAFSDEQLRGFQRVVVLGMGTSLHAGMVGRNWLENFARISAEADNSSEFRYRDPVLN